MDILIKGMEMPKSCYSEVYSENGYCPFHCFDYHGGSHCTISACKCLKTRRPKDCPLVELPPHGRLVSADEVQKKMSYYGFRAIDMTIHEFVEDELTTVLEAST